MYVTTFYSFKGGVGRTMALVNVAAELARRGRRVLAVDFDLEAPGLDTFDLPRGSGSTPGVVDFVKEYMETGQAPEAERFVFESPGTGSNGGGIWIMPAGTHGSTYESLLASIDWLELYEHHDGYLLFEDLKAQWKELFKPDYVLIDSRTGHTDIGGICTRQLPNSVAVLFFPNMQNLRGLTKVVRDIRTEKSKQFNRLTKLHFIMSNVPDLDDEDSILQQIIDSFKKDLVFDELMRIHRYDSLSLLNQVIFTKDRPKSRLAKEYRRLAARIMRFNPEDRDGAMEFMFSARATRWHERRHRGRYSPRQEFDEHLTRIETNHVTDGEVLFRLGSLHEGRGALDRAGTLFDKAIAAGYRDPDVYLDRASIRMRELGDSDGASQDAAKVFEFSRASYRQVIRALGLVGLEQLERVAHSPAVAGLRPDERVEMARQLDKSISEAEVAREVLRPLVEQNELSAESMQKAREGLVVACLALRKFSEAIKVIQDEEADLSKMEIDSAFNLGMALWGQSGKVDPEPFQRVVYCDRFNPPKDPSPNYLQCMAIAYWAIGESGTAAVDLAFDALDKVRKIHSQQFSCWRYQRVPMSDFEKDMQEIIDLCLDTENEDAVKPRFFIPPVPIPF